VIALPVIRLIEKLEFFEIEHGTSRIDDVKQRQTVINALDFPTPFCPRMMESFLESIGTSEYFTVPQHPQEVKHID
jgi:hypothetical protein